MLSDKQKIQALENQVVKLARALTQAAEDLQVAESWSAADDALAAIPKRLPCSYVLPDDFFEEIRA